MPATPPTTPPTIAPTFECGLPVDASVVDVAKLEETVELVFEAAKPVKKVAEIEGAERVEEAEEVQKFEELKPDVMAGVDSGA